MKSWQILESGNLEQFKLQDIQQDKLSKGKVRVRVRAIGVNPADLMQAMGTHQNPPPIPFSPGFEISGEVSESHSEIYKEGDRVMASMDFGAYQEYVDVSENLLEIIPETVSFTQASAIPIAYGTAYISMLHRGNLKSGESLMIFGATGGVGSRTVEIGAAKGAHVIAIYSKAEEMDYLKSLGADEYINYKTEEIIARAKEITAGKGVDVIADLVGGDMFQKALESVAWEGRILPIGAASGEIPQLTSLDMLVRNASLVGTDFAAYIVNKPKIVRKAFQKLFKWHAKGRLNFPEPNNILPFEDARSVFQKMSERSLKGKTVLTL
ncbi:NADPH:quinone oxidoreductase family protein [Aquimarina sp. U1-2]|uniref:NADPH:quinone oxidoreductase family protein n=1 Tax=Aquimarina sp. U1-2 TaxID=2823141 RepID=UPI001AECD465|nr:NADPH:quinone oxidoreductase family protein [Aquimarina sp. U1-2]MBP2833769.1 NADPH:quinone oxidoreductase family protein [Aquimarina sp. U1-2]